MICSSDFDVGSSPRMRGARYLCRLCDYSVGIIPADAGSTQVRRSPWTKRRDHPRGCGEHRRFSDPAWAVRGSSPRMRGALQAQGAGKKIGRIIPADAGSTNGRMPRICRLGDHPRGCGEHISTPTVTLDVTGSSPRMRGARSLHTSQSQIRGIIPADAGSTP